MQLRNAKVLAEHVGQCHTDQDWRLAGNEVAEACRKYEQHLYASKGVYQKLEHCAKSLHDNQHQTEGQAHNTGHQLRQLCHVLLHVLAQKGALVMDSQMWMVSVHMPDPMLDDLHRLKQQEQDLLSCIDSLMTNTGAMLLMLTA